MTTLEIQKETIVNTNSNLSFYCTVTLKDSEQILLDIEEREWSNGNYQGTGVIKKFRLEKITYQNYSRTDYNTVNLYSIEVRGFRKDKGLRYRTDQFHNIEQKMIDQIPDHYHNYAREAFAKEAIALQERLTLMTNEGVKVEPRN
jgi:hypothetical protein